MGVHPEAARALEVAERSVAEATKRLDWATESLVKAKTQVACKHEHIDERGVFGDTCRDCGLFFNNGGF